MTTSERLFKELKCSLSDGSVAHVIPHCNYVPGLHYLWTDGEAYCNGVEDFTMDVYWDPQDDELYAVPDSIADFATLMDDAICSCGNEDCIMRWLAVGFPDWIDIEVRMQDVRDLDYYVELYEAFVNIWKEVNNQC